MIYGKMARSFSHSFSLFPVKILPFMDTNFCGFGKKNKFVDP